MAHLEPHRASAQDGSARLELKLQPWQRNGMGVAHGGVIMTLLDAVMAMAAKSADPAGAWVVTIEMKTSFLRPGRDELIALGFCEHRSTSMAFAVGKFKTPREGSLQRPWAPFDA